MASALRPTTKFCSDGAAAGLMSKSNCFMLDYFKAKLLKIGIATQIIISGVAQTYRNGGAYWQG